MEMPKPSDAHRKLEKLAGSWRGEETLFPSPWDPKGGTAIGRINSRVALDGFAVIGDYEQERQGAVSFRGHGVYTYSPQEKCYLLYWFDSMGMGAEIFRGNFAGPVLTLNSKNPNGHARLTYDFADDKRLRSRMEMSPDGQSWNTFFEGSYAKA